MKTVSKKLLSLLLVALLLVSAVPFQAFADHDPDTHVMGAWTSNGDGTHTKACTDSTCTYAETNACTYVNGACSVCAYPCPHTTTSVVGAVAATCVKDGYTGDTVCATCGTKTAAGTVVPATGAHNFVDGKCTNCPATQAGKAATLTLDAGDGKVEGGSYLLVNVNQFAPVNVLPDAVRPGYTFAGWFIDGVQIHRGENYAFDIDKTATAKWTEQTFGLTVYRVLNGDSKTAKVIYTAEVSKGTNLLDYLKANVSATVTYEKSITPGFSWENSYWYDYSGKQPLASQSDFMDQARTVYVNFKSNAYSLYFNANGGTVTPTYKTVYYGSAVGALPTPVKEGSVFQGWQDSAGKIYTANTVYEIAGDTSLTAVWSDQVQVMLHVYVNGDFSAPHTLIPLDGFVKNSQVSRDDVVKEITKRYAPASGSSLSVAGLFDEATWASYRANVSKNGTPTISVNKDVKKVFVMVNNVKTSTIITNNTTTNTTTGTNGAYWVSTGNGTGYWVYPSNNTNVTYTGTNPKTGDTAMVEAAAAIMVLAAGALVTMMAMRKRKMF